MSPQSDLDKDFLAVIECRKFLVKNTYQKQPKLDAQLAFKKMKNKDSIFNSFTMQILNITSKITWSQLARYNKSLCGKANNNVPTKLIFHNLHMRIMQ